MIQPLEIFPGVRLRCVQTDRFKSSCCSLNLLRPLSSSEAAKNALLSSVLMQGTRLHPDMQSLSLALDELYGTSMGPMCRKNGDIQTVGFYLSCLEDQYTMDGDQVLEPAIKLLSEVLLDPLLEGGSFSQEIVAIEKENLVNSIEASINDKKVYADTKMLRAMCRDDVYGVPRLGLKEDVQSITAENLYRHYKEILASSQIEIFYAGSRPQQEIAAMLKKALHQLPRKELTSVSSSPLPHHQKVQYLEETMDITQGKLSMGFTLDTTSKSEDYPYLMLFNAVFGGDMTSKLFMNVREKLSLCYYASSAAISPKGMMVVSCGIDTGNYQTAVDEIMHQLELCQKGEIEAEELEAARKSIISGLNSLSDSIGAMEDFSSFQALSGFTLDPAEYREIVSKATIQDIARIASQVQLDTIFFLKGGAV